MSLTPFQYWYKFDITLPLKEYSPIFGEVEKWQKFAQCISDILYDDRENSIVITSCNHYRCNWCRDVQDLLPGYITRLYNEYVPDILHISNDIIAVTGIKSDQFQYRTTFEKDFEPDSCRGNGLKVSTQIRYNPVEQLRREQTDEVFVMAQDWFAAMQNGTVEYRQPDLFYKPRYDGQPEVTASHADAVIKAIDDDFNMDALFTQGRKFGSTGQPEFHRLKTQQRIALVQQYASIILSEAEMQDESEKRIDTAYELTSELQLRYPLFIISGDAETAKESRLAW